MARLDIHADMMTLQARYPWQDPEFVAAEDAEIVAFHDEAREAWLDDWLADLEEEPEEEEPVEEDELVLEYSAADYVPSQLPASEYAGCYGNVTAEPGYYESLYPFAF